MIAKILVVASLGAAGGIALIGFIVLQGPQNSEFVPENELPREQLFVPQVVSHSLPEENKQEEETEKREMRAAPQEVRGVYLTRWSAGAPARLQQVLDLAQEGIVNAVVIDLKDFSGFLAYDTDVPLAKAIGAEQNNIRNPESYLARLREANLYTIARITVFQDPLLAEARPDLAIKSAATQDQELWRDKKGLAWLDPAAEEVWQYHADLAKDAFTKGFDEVNFDYVRFPSDGDIFDASYPFWDEETPLPEIISSLFAYLDKELREYNTSVDLFGLAAANTWDDMGIGQVLEDAFPSFDYVSPMVYPSHFARGFRGFEHPDEHPYEIVHFSMKRAKERREQFLEENETAAKLRPWIQYFDLAGSRTEYTPAVVREQILATQDALGEEYGGYLLWNSANIYPLEEVKEIVFGPQGEEQAQETP